VGVLKVDVGRAVAELVVALRLVVEKALAWWSKVADDIYSHLSYVKEGTIDDDETVYLYVKDDEQYGLREPADSGYLVNDGPGTLTVRSSDDGERYTAPMTVYSGEMLVWELDDDEYVDRVYFTCDTDGTKYRARFARRRKE